MPDPFPPEQHFASNDHVWQALDLEDWEARCDNCNRAQSYVRIGPIAITDVVRLCLCARCVACRCETRHVFPPCLPPGVGATSTGSPSIDGWGRLGER